MTETRKANGHAHRAVNEDAGYLFRVPADKKGRRFVAQLRAHINRHDVERVRVLCNGPRKDAAIADGRWTRSYQSYLPQRHATEFRIYVDRTSDRDRWRKTHDAAREIDRLTLSGERLKDELVRALSDYHEAATNAAKYRNVPNWIVRLCDWAARKVR